MVGGDERNQGKEKYLSRGNTRRWAQGKFVRKSDQAHEPLKGKCMHKPMHSCPTHVELHSMHNGTPAINTCKAKGTYSELPCENWHEKSS